MGGRISSPPSEPGGTSALPRSLVPRLVPVAVTLRESGDLPAFEPCAGGVLDPSPLRDLPQGQRVRRLVGLLELLASHGDGGAAAEALRHHRWAEEMRRGKAPQRVDLHATGAITVIDTLSAPAGTPIPRGKALPRT